MLKNYKKFFLVNYKKLVPE